MHTAGEIQSTLAQIPIRHNVASMIMLCGLVQGFVLSAVIALRSGPNNQPLRLMGGFLFLLSLVGLDVYLCYTGLMKYTLWANDSTEVFILMLGPLVYFFLRSLLQKERIEFRENWLHFVLPGLYLLLHLIHFFQPSAVKLNCYLDAYFPHLPFVTEPPRSALTNFSFAVRSQWRWMMLGSFSVYSFLSARIILQQGNKIRNYFWLDPNTDKYSFSKNLVWLFLAGFLIIAIVFLNYENDLGDHYISIFFSLVIYGTSILMLSESRFFEKSWIADKYDTSGLKTDAKKIVDRAVSYIRQEGYHLQPDGSLKDLARRLDLAPNYLSQAVNTQTGQNFNDFINQFRIAEAKKRLVDDNYAHLNIAGIGQTVGFNSKSAFYAAFKKHAETTPSAYLKKVRKNGIKAS